MGFSCLDWFCEHELPWMNWWLALIVIVNCGAVKVICRFDMDCVKKLWCGYGLAVLGADWVVVCWFAVVVIGFNGCGLVNWN